MSQKSMGMKDLRQEDRSTQMAEVLRLNLIEGKGINAICRETMLGRKKVRKLLGVARGEQTLKVAAERSSILVPYGDDIRKALDDCPEMKAPAVLDRIRAKGYQGGITVLRDHLRKIRPRPKQEAFLTRSYEPGRMLQVDWADFGFAIPGCARRVSAFVAALAFSRYLFLVFTLSQAMGSFLRCMDQALRFFGGRTLVDVFDNMKTVVLERTAHTVRFHPRFVEYARTRGFGIQACAPRRPTEKPYVERPIGTIRTRFWPGRHPTDLFDLNAQATRWRDNIFNNVINEETGKVPSLVFRNEEQKLLTPVPETFFDTDDLVSTGISKTFRVDFDRNDYTTPWRLVGQSVLVRGDEQEVSIFLGTKQVAVHNRCWDVGKLIRDDSHEQGLLERKPRAAAGALPPELRGLSGPAEEYFKILAANSRSLRREIQLLVLLSELYGDAPVRSAMGEVMTTGHVGAEYVEYVLRYKKGLTPGPAALKLNDPALDSIHLGEPDLAAYDQPRKTLDPGDPPKVDPAEPPEKKNP
jgi:transposase